MRAVVQRVLKASVTIEGEKVASIDKGLLILVGVRPEDTAKDIQYMVNKFLGLRIFEDENGKMNHSVKDAALELLIVPNFTLYGNATKGLRPSFVAAGAPDQARIKYEELLTHLKEQDFPFATGSFQADMKVELINDGPVTILLDSEKTF